MADKLNERCGSFFLFSLCGAGVKRLMSEKICENHTKKSIDFVIHDDMNTLFLYTIDKQKER